MLNSQQQTAFDTIVAMTAHDKLRLDGEGGCGKTYVLTTVVEHLIREGKKPLVVAPTHMARQNLVDKVNPEVRHLVENRTLASLLGRFGIRGGEGSTVFVNPKAPNTAQYDLIIIDEISMMSQKDLMALAACPVPIVFSGDLKQLPVVKQKKAVWDHIPVLRLTEQMRQSGAILELAQRLRSEIAFPSHSVPSDGLWVHSEQELLPKFISDLKLNSDRQWAYRFLTYTNNSVYEINSTVRHSLHGNAAAEPWLTGEYIILQQTCAAGHNAEILQITDVLDFEPNKAYPELTDWIIELENGHALRVLAPSDRRKVDVIKKELRDKLVLAKKLKLSSTIAQLLGEIEYLDLHWVDVNYTYATTVHKSQGMTIPHVYVDTIALNRASNKRALLYVAFSRASENLHVSEVELSGRALSAQINSEYKATESMFKVKYGSTYRRFYSQMLGESIAINSSNRAEVITRINLVDECLSTLGKAIKTNTLVPVLAALS